MQKHQFHQNLQKICGQGFHQEGCFEPAPLSCNTEGVPFVTSNLGAPQKPSETNWELPEISRWNCFSALVGHRSHV